MVIDEAIKWTLLPAGCFVWFPHEVVEVVCFFRPPFLHFSFLFLSLLLNIFVSQATYVKIHFNTFILMVNWVIIQNVTILHLNLPYFYRIDSLCISLQYVNRYRLENKKHKVISHKCSKEKLPFYNTIYYTLRQFNMHYDTFHGLI